MKSGVTLPLIIAHRGSSAFAPENTLAAFSRALDDGAEGFEFDVRITGDGIPVVFHDFDLKRIAGSEDRIDAISLSELDSVDVGSWFDANNPEKARFAGEGIPTLASVMLLLRDFQGPVFVELKSTLDTADRLADAVGELLRQFAGSQQLIVKSFDFEIVRMVKEICPEIQTAALFAPNIIRLVRKEKRLINIAKEVPVDRLSIHYSLLTKKLMRKARKAGLPVTIWTVDKPRWLKRSIRLGVDSIITNDPARLLNARKQKMPEELIRVKNF